MEKIKQIITRPQVWGFFVSVAIIAIISLAFFYPDNFEGNTLRQHDMQQGAANGHEGLVYEEQTGEKALWTNSLFGGMPTFQISPSYPSNSLFSWINTVYGLGLPAPSNLLCMMMLGFLILLFTLRLRWYYALIGAVAWGFSSYFIIIIGAGHIWKFLALTYVPPMIAGALLLYRGERIVGTALTAIAAMMQLNANHPQMSYYFVLLTAIIGIAYLVAAVRQHTVRTWLAATGLLVLAGLLAVGANAPSLYNTYEYSKATTRGSSELTDSRSEESADPAERPTGGIPRDQIVGYSYGRTESLSLLVPNIRGGASVRPEGGQLQSLSLAQLDGADQYASAAPLLQYLSQYFNDSEGTNGPVYVGIIVFALFVLGCFTVRGPLKWALLAATVLSILLAMGRNAAWLTDLMIYHFPLYNKFRAVESILVIAEFCIPLLAILGLSQLLEKGREDSKALKRPLLWSVGIPAAVCIILILVPGLFGIEPTQSDMAASQQVQDYIVSQGQQAGASQQQIQQIAYQYSLANSANREAAESLRKGLVRSDALRSLIFLLIAAAFVGLYLRGKTTKGVAAAAVGLLVLFDLYGVDKRYVSHSSFCPSDTYGGQIAFTPDDVDNAILADTSAHYRVLDVPGFYSADRSYFHRTLGGYHAAKLSRYDDLIRHRLGLIAQLGYFPDDPALDDPQYAEIAGSLRSAYAVADMLNARYVITGDPAQPLIRNDYALGNAWLVDSLLWVGSADEEMSALDASRIDIGRQAVADRRFASVLPEQPSLAPGDTIYLTSYTPNTLTYHCATDGGGVAVFSEVYFPWGWKATIDGQPAELARVNYLLRAMAVPAGSHTLAMTFSPDSLGITGGLAYACVTLIYLLLLGAMFVAARRWKVF